MSVGLKLILSVFIEMVFMGIILRDILMAIAIIQTLKEELEI